MKPDCAAFRDQNLHLLEEMVASNRLPSLRTTIKSPGVRTRRGPTPLANAPKQVGQTTAPKALSVSTTFAEPAGSGSSSRGPLETVTRLVDTDAKHRTGTREGTLKLLVQGMALKLSSRRRAPVVHGRQSTKGTVTLGNLGTPSLGDNALRGR